MNTQNQNPTLKLDAIEKATALLEKRESKLSLLELEPMTKPFSNNGLQAYCDYNLKR